MIVHVPAEYDVAKTESALNGGKEFILVQVLAPEHAVNVGHRHLDPVSGRAADGVEHLLWCDFLRHDVLPVDLRCRVVALAAIVTCARATGPTGDAVRGTMAA